MCIFVEIGASPIIAAPQRITSSGQHDLGAAAGGLLSNAQITALLIVPLGQNDTSLKSLDLSSLLGPQLQDKLQPLLLDPKGLENDKTLTALASALEKKITPETKQQLLTSTA